MKPAGDFVAAGAKLAPGMKHGQHGFEGRFFGLLVLFHRNAAAVISHLRRAIRAYFHINNARKPGHCLVNTIVYDLPQEMMESALGRVADVHARTLPDRLKTLEDGDLLRAVFT